MKQNFSNISGSIIVNESQLISEVSAALQSVRSPEADKLLSDLKDQLASQAQDKSAVRRTWLNLVRLVPALHSATELFNKVAG